MVAALSAVRANAGLDAAARLTNSRTDATRSNSAGECTCSAGTASGRTSRVLSPESAKGLRDVARTRVARHRVVITATTARRLQHVLAVVEHDEHAGRTERPRCRVDRSFPATGGRAGDDERFTHRPGRALGRDRRNGCRRGRGVAPPLRPSRRGGSYRRRPGPHSVTRRWTPSRRSISLISSSRPTSSDSSGGRSSIPQ